MVTRREFLGTTLGTTTLLTTSAFAQSTSRRPNVLFILADDMGYGDLSCYGRPDYQTPVLDNLARQGIRFTSAYAAAPVCTPTRCAFVTGRYPHRLAVGLKEPLTDPTSDIGLPPEHPTVASLLKANGYQTALVGKWHLGWKPEFGPNRHGYEEFFGILSGAADYFTHRAEDSQRFRSLGESDACPTPRLLDRSPDGEGCRVHRPSPKQALLSQPSLHRAAFAVGRTGGFGD